MTMNDLLETMQIFFFSRDQKDTINVHMFMNGWMFTLEFGLSKIFICGGN